MNNNKNGLFTGFMYVLLVLLTVGLGFLVFFNYQANERQKEQIEAIQEAANTTPTPEPVATPEPTATPTRTAETFTMAFAGDLVGQAGLTTDAKRTADDGTVSYDFVSELDGVRTGLEGADITACTLVSRLSGLGEYDSYSMPPAMADALKDVGFSLVNVATDHIMDRGLEGLTETVQTLQNSGLGVLGASASSSRSRIMATVNGVKVAFLSYTYSTAGGTSEPVSVADNSWCLDLLTTDYMTAKETVDYERIDGDIATMRQAGADIVVCFVYWWDNDQYYTEPRANQTEVVDHLLQSGVDILVGGGVKVPQPIEVRTVEREDGKANCVVLNSLSNLMSCFGDAYTNLSAVARVEVSRDVNDGSVWISGVSARPLFMLDTGDYEDYSAPEFKYRLLDARQAIIANDQGGGVLSASAYEAVEKGVDDLKLLLGEDFDDDIGGMSIDYPY